MPGQANVVSGAGPLPAAPEADGSVAPKARRKRKGSRPDLPIEADGLPAWFAGLDEAGRGPVLGPLVVAGVAGRDWALFKKLGCTDSKLLSAERRQAIDRALRAAPGLRIEVRVIGPETIDAERRQGVGLNQIEARRFNDIARSLGARHLWADAADVDEARFGREVVAGLDGVAIVSEHEADLNYPVVGAASIVAKVARDAAIAELARRLERQLSTPLELGSGYSHDPKTQAFLAAWVREHRSLPEGTRHTWATAQALLAPKATKLEMFAS